MTFLLCKYDNRKIKGNLTNNHVDTLFAVQVLGVDEADNPHIHSSVHDECQPHGSCGALPLHVDRCGPQALRREVYTVCMFLNER